MWVASQAGNSTPFRSTRTHAQASDLRTGAGRMHACRPYTPAPDSRTGAGHYALALDLGTGPVLMYGRRTYADSPDLCAGAGLMHGHRTYARALDLRTGARPYAQVHKSGAHAQCRRPRTMPAPVHKTRPAHKTGASA